MSTNPQENHIHECDGEGHVHHHHEDGSCCCHHHEKEYHGFNKIMLFRIVISAVCFLIHEVLHDNQLVAEILLFACIIISGYDIIIEAVKNLFKLRLFDEYFLMTFAAVAACIVGELHEGAAVMLLFRIGDFCQECAVQKSKKTVYFFNTNDGHDEGTGNKTEKFITRFSKIYTPSILAIALMIVVVLPIFSDISISDAVYRALTFLVLACPCAVVISVPLAYSAGISAAAKRDVFFRDSNQIDIIASEKSVKHLSLTRKDGYAYINGSHIILRNNASVQMAYSIAKRTRTIAWENICITIIIKFAVLILGAFGISALWFAVFADSGITLLLTLNSLRAFIIPK